MKFGASAYITDKGIDAITCARAMESAGFDSMWVGEHSHTPTSERTPYETARGSLIPEMNPRHLDPFVVLTAAAAVTTDLRVGTSVCLLPQRDTIQLAKQVASLDYLSKGRMLLSIGAGWNIQELENHGVDPETRFEKMQEQVEAMTAIWTQERAEYKGRFVQFEELWAWPKPVQAPRPPVIVGSHIPDSLEVALTWGDAWSLKYGDPEMARIPELQERAHAAGKKVPVMIGVVPEEPAVIEELMAIDGIERLVFAVTSHERADGRLEPLPTEGAVEKIAQVGKLLDSYR